MRNIDTRAITGICCFHKERENFKMLHISRFPAFVLRSVLKFHVIITREGVYKGITFNPFPAISTYICLF